MAAADGARLPPTALDFPARIGTARTMKLPRTGPSRAVTRVRRTPLLVTAGATAAVLVAATAVDLAVEHTAQQRIADAAACRLKTTGPVSADLTGTLAGLRAVTGNLGSVHIAADGVRRDGTAMDIAADLHDVTTGGTISGGTATATIAYGELQRRLGAEDSAAEGMTVGSDGGGGLTLTGRVGSLGIPVTVHTRVSTAADSLTVTPSSVTVLGQDVAVSRLASLPGGAELARRLTPRTVALPALPSGVTLTAARPGGAGLTLELRLTPRAGTAGHECA